MRRCGASPIRRGSTSACRRCRSRTRELPPTSWPITWPQRGIFAWHGNFYALQLTESLGLEPEGLVRLGLLHYNTADEVERLLAALANWNERPPATRRTTMEPRPDKLELRGGNQLLIEWSDGQQREITVRRAARRLPLRHLPREAGQAARAQPADCTCCRWPRPGR